MNLPVLALEEINGRRFSGLTVSSVLKHTYWINFSTDIFSARKHIQAGNLTLFQWLRELYSCSSFAYWRLMDPLPMLVKTKQLLFRLLSSVAK